MKIFKFVFLLIVSSLLIHYANTRIPGEEKSIPPLGKVLNPFGGFWQNADNPNSIKDISFDSKKVSSKVHIIYDERMVPHIYADNLNDAMYAQGYVEAQNRLWQMDFSSRAAAGRLSEVAGEKTLEADKRSIRMGIRRGAKQAVKDWSRFPGEMDKMNSYCNGVNDFLKTLDPKDYPVEFKLIDYKPEEWTPYRSALIAKAMAEVLASREDDLESSNMLNYLGPEKFNFLYPEWNPKQSPIIPEGTEWKSENKKDSVDYSDISIDHIIFSKSREKPESGLGSNNWAVGGQKTKNGRPILCNDPHLSLSLPSVWFEVHIHTPEFNAYGVSIPGIPGILIGFNDHVAWGETNVGHDIMDWFEIEWADEEKTKYYLDGKVQDVVYSYEKIKVRGQKEIIDTVKHTVWGPIVFEDDQRYQNLAMRWLATYPIDSPELNTFVELMRAKSYDDYENALLPYVSPAQNFIFASKEGDIAIAVNGKFPVKKNQEGRFVQKGNSTDKALKAFIPKSEIPKIKNPERNFVSSANQHSTDPSYPYYYNGGFEDYRGRIINRLLEEKESITVEDMKTLQYNSFNLKASEILPILLENLKIEELSDSLKNLVNVLEDWDYHYYKDEAAPAIFNNWYSKFYRMTWDEIYSVRDSFNVLFPESWRLIEIASNDPENEYFDIITTQDTKETLSDIVQLSFMEAGNDYLEWNNKGNSSWGDLSPVSINHLANIPSFSAKVKSDGHRDAINAKGGSFGPSWRMVVELTDETRAFGVYPGGQSGNPGSPYYDLGLEKWSKGEYYELSFNKSKKELEEKRLFKIEIDTNE